MRVRNLIVAIAIAAATASTPALAAGQHHNRAGFNAYGAAPGVTESLSAERDAALRECNAATSSMRDTTWGNTVANTYRSCMARHGQPE